METGNADKWVEQLFKVFNHCEMNTILLLDTKGMILKVNAAFIEHFHFKEEEIVGKHLRALCTEEDRKAGMAEKEVREVLATKQSNDNNSLVCGDGKTVWVSGESILCEIGEERYILKVIQDIHEHKEQQLECLQLKNFNENILATIDDAVLVIDQDKSIIKYNANYIALYGGLKPYMDYEKLTNLIVAPGVKSDLMARIDRALKEQKVFRNFEVEILTPKGVSRTFEITGKPLLEESGEYDVLLVLHDISVLREVQNDREDVLGFVAHELRNPMTNLKLCNEVLGMFLKEKENQPARDILEKSNNNIERLNKLVADLYDSTKIYGSKDNLELRVFDAEEMIGDAIETIEGQFPDFKIVKTGNANATIMADKFKLIQVLTNYLSNAVKYSGDGKEVRLHVETNGTTLRVSVTDDGIGIPESQLPYIFTRFFRSEKTDNLEGLGLGLYLSKLIINAHHGTVGVDSEESKGSTFYFEIPLSREGNEVDR